MQSIDESDTKLQQIAQQYLKLLDLNIEFDKKKQLADQHFVVRNCIKIQRFCRQLRLRKLARCAAKIQAQARLKLQRLRSRRARLEVIRASLARYRLRRFFAFARKKCLIRRQLRALGTGALVLASEAIRERLGEVIRI